VLKWIGNYARDVHFQIPDIVLKINKTPPKAMEILKSNVKNVYQQSIGYNRDKQRDNMMDKHQAHLEATLIKESSDFILNTSSDQLTAIQNNQLLVTSKLLASNTRPKSQLKLLFRIGATLFSLYNYIYQWADD
jgi:hypothetical protein